MHIHPARLSVVVAVLAAGAMFACSSPEKELRKAKEAGTVQALDAFLAKHPEGPLAEQAKDAKEELIFKGVKNVNTLASYEGFLKLYPNGKLASAALAAIEELHFREAEAAGNIEAYDRFLNQYPKGAFAAKASQALERLLPGGVYATVEVNSTEPERCTIHTTVTILHKTGAVTLDPPPSVEPDTMVCGPEVGKTAVAIEKIERRDPNHTLVGVKVSSASGCSECRGTCTARFLILGQEQVVTGVYK
jgi:hypothetical protein